MTCWGVRRRMSAHLDGELGGAEAHALEAHLADCPRCAARWESLQRSVAWLGEVGGAWPELGVAARVRERIELEQGHPALTIVLRGGWGRRRLLPAALAPATLAVLTLLAAAAGLWTTPEDAGLPPVHQAAWGSEADPLSPSETLSMPVSRTRDAWPETSPAEPDENLFFVTIVGRDGRVASVHLLEGDAASAALFVPVLRSERFEPVHYRGRAVAVSVCRLISHLEVRSSSPT